MKAAVLARGFASRMRAADPATALAGEQAAAADAGLKAMMPVGPPRADGAGRPFLDFVLSELADAGATDVALVVGPDADTARRWYAHESPPERVRLSFVVQPQALGTASAVLACETWAGADPFLVLNGDNLYPAGVLRPLVALGEPGLPIFRAAELARTSNITPLRVGTFALLELTADGYLERIVEKPGEAAVAAAGERAWISMNCWRFDHAIFAACRDVARSTRGEFELPQAVALGLSRGLRFKALPASGEVLDLSSRGDVVDVIRRLSGREPHP